MSAISWLNIEGAPGFVAAKKKLLHAGI